MSRSLTFATSQAIFEGVRRRREGVGSRPQQAEVSLTEGAERPLHAADHLDHPQAVGAPLYAQASFLRVTVAYYPARLEHPVEQFLECLRVVIGAGRIVWHLLRLERRAAKLNPKHGGKAA